MILSHWLWVESTITDSTSEKDACKVFKGISPPLCFSQVCNHTNDDLTENFVTFLLEAIQSLVVYGFRANQHGHWVPIPDKQARPALVPLRNILKKRSFSQTFLQIFFSKHSTVVLLLSANGLVFTFRFGNSGLLRVRIQAF